MNNHKYFLDQAYKQAVKAYNMNEVPVGCVVVKDNIIISRSHNLTNYYHSPLCHAELNAIKEIFYGGDLFSEKEIYNEEFNKIGELFSERETYNKELSKSKEVSNIGEFSKCDNIFNNDENCNCGDISNHRESSKSDNIFNNDEFNDREDLSNKSELYKIDNVNNKESSKSENINNELNKNRNIKYVEDCNKSKYKLNIKSFYRNKENEDIQNNSTIDKSSYNKHTINNFVYDEPSEHNINRPNEFNSTFDKYNINKPTHNINKPTHNINKPTHNINKPTHNINKPTHNINKPTHNNTLLNKFNHTLNKYNIKTSSNNTLTFYITCEPCVMCLGILDRLNCKVFYGCKNSIFGGTSVIKQEYEWMNFIEDKRCYEILQVFYKRENVNCPVVCRKKK
ncbi:cytosine adenosine deaminase [Vairimorpha apis BRL 01]|uniref:Cytosine adenosine deaminase n=1 Tax=Vairimorpha apis BRL 01 TaxID=1037528 RepID=T0L587_9MICR|nr:cytosine adenosine deaminase [Vairimorpha apis BRL 01]